MVLNKWHSGVGQLLPCRMSLNNWLWQKQKTENIEKTEKNKIPLKHNKGYLQEYLQKLQKISDEWKHWSNSFHILTVSSITNQSQTF